MLPKIFRSNHPDVVYRKDVLSNFTKFTGKHLCQSLFFIKVAVLRPTTLLKKRPWHRCFPVNFLKFLNISEGCFWILPVTLICEIMGIYFTVYHNIFQILNFLFFITYILDKRKIIMINFLVFRDWNQDLRKLSLPQVIVSNKIGCFLKFCTIWSGCIRSSIFYV